MFTSHMTNAAQCADIPPFNIYETYSAGPASQGLVTPQAFPVATEPYIQETFTPLQEAIPDPIDTRYDFLRQFSIDHSPFWKPEDEKKFQDFQFDLPASAFYKPIEQVPAHRQEAEITPIAGPITHMKDVSNTDGEILVGMGLYDTPSPTPPTSLFSGMTFDLPVRGSNGKGLKLEETWEPGASTEDDDGGDDGGDDEADETVESVHEQGSHDYRTSAKLSSDILSHDWSQNSATYSPLGYQTYYAQTASSPTAAVPVSSNWNSTFSNNTYGWI